MWYYLKKIGFFLLDHLYPPQCIACQKHLFKQGIYHTPLCSDCFFTIEFIRSPICKRCGMGLEYDTKICGKCHKKSFNRCRFVTLYRGNCIKRLHQKLKYQDQESVSELFSQFVFFEIPPCDDYWKSFDIITVVPLHFFRLLKRKYNQSCLIAQSILQKIPKESAPNFIPTLLKRHQNTKPQSKDFKNRFLNVRNAFSFNKSYSVLDKSVLIIDDVITSGATLHFCAKELKKMGAKRVEVLCISKAK